MRLNETYSRVRIGKYVADMFTIQNGLKQGDALSPLLFKLLWNMRQEGPRERGRTDTEWDTSAFGLLIYWGENIDTI
jgi:hypothetical protein